MRVQAKLYLNSTTLLSFNNIIIKRAEKIKSDYMEVVFTEDDLFLNGGIFNIKEDDTLTCYARVDYDGSTLDTSTSSNDLLFNGIVKEIKIVKDNKQRKYIIKSVNRSYELLNRLWGKSYNDTAPNIIKNLIEFGSLQPDGTSSITATIDTGYPYTSGIQGKRPDGTDFPTIQFGMSHKPIFEFIDNLSQIEHTNTPTEINAGTNPCKRPFKYYIDGNNVFQWFYPSDTPNYEFRVGATSPIGSDTKTHYISSYNLKYSQFDEINFIIFKAGEDMDNVQILDFDLDPTAKSLTTADSFRSWLDIARDMKRADAAAGNITFVEGDKYNYPSSYPVTPAWNISVTVNNDSEYNDEFRKEAIRRAKARCQALFRETGNPRWQGTITIYGENINPTELIKFTDPDVTELTDKNLRIESLTHNITKNSFTTILNVKEDIPEAS